MFCFPVTILEGEFSQAGQVALDAVAQVTLGVEDFTQSVVNATMATVDFFETVATGTEQAFLLEQQLIANEKALADQAVIQAQSILQQKELNLLIEDQNASFEDRIAAAEEFQRVEAAQIAESIRLQEERIRLLKAQNDITNSTEEDIQRVRDAEIELAQLQAASFEREVTNQNKLNTIRNQQRAEQLAADKAAAAEREKLFDEQEKAILKRLDDQAKEEEEFRKNQVKQAEAVQKAQLDLQREGLAATKQTFSEATLLGRTVALAEIAQSTARAIAGLTAASQANPANAFTFGGAGAAQFAAGIAIITANISRATKLIGASAPNISGSNKQFAERAKRLEELREQQAIDSLASQDSRNNAQAAADNVQAVQESIENQNVQVAVTDINTAQNNRQVKVNESNLG